MTGRYLTSSYTIRTPPLFQTIRVAPKSQIHKLPIADAFLFQPVLLVPKCQTYLYVSLRSTSHETSLPNERKRGIRVVLFSLKSSSWKRGLGLLKRGALFTDSELGRIFADLCDLAAAAVVPHPLSWFWQCNIDPGEVLCPAVLVRTSARVCGGYLVSRAHKTSPRVDHILYLPLKLTA